MPEKNGTSSGKWEYLVGDMRLLFRLPGQDWFHTHRYGVQFNKAIEEVSEGGGGEVIWEAA